MLADAGFDADGYMVVDDTYDLATAVAVLAWWHRDGRTKLSRC